MSWIRRLGVLCGISAFLAQPVSADIRTLVLFDVSDSLSAYEIPSNHCGDAFILCRRPMWNAHFLALQQALTTLPDPKCAQSYLLPVRFAYHSYPEVTWHQLDTFDHRHGLSLFLVGHQMRTNAGTKIMWAFDRALQQIAAEDSGLKTIILLSDGIEFDGWSPSYGASEAARYGVDFHQVTLMPTKSFEQLVAELGDILVGIHSQPYQCYG